MPIPLLEITPTTQNQRVEGYEVPDEDEPQIYRLVDATSVSEVNKIIWAAYRQIFSEHLILESYRQLSLESLLRNRYISVQGFIRGLGKSEVYRELVAETNSNYRLVDITFKRFLGRATYNQDEQIAWSIVIASKGLHGFIDAIVDSEEYKQNFGDDIVPFQRRRFNERPFNLVNPRYSDYWRARQVSFQGSFYQVRISGQSEQPKIRQAIPNTFLSMARSIAPLGASADYQRSKDRAISIANNFQLDTVSKAVTPRPFASPTQVALPYRYIPSTPKV